MRSVLGDSNWWPMPPTFGVPPLDSNRLPTTISFEVGQIYLHVGTAEAVGVSYIVLASSTIASLVMTNLLAAAQATPVTSPKVGDQTLYVQAMGTGAAPFGATVYVKVGPTITAVEWFRKDAFASTNQLANVARKATTHVKDVVAGKFHASPPPQIDTSQLPPPGFNITLLGYTRVPTEAVVLDLGYSSAPEQIATIFKQGGVNDALYGDYVLNADTHMEVKVLLMGFADPAVASQWLDLIRGGAPLDANGIFSTYSEARGTYFYAFAAGGDAALLTCAATGPNEAASRACEVPLADESVAWKLGLGG